MADTNIANRSVVNQPVYEEGAFAPFVLWLASIADDIQAWGGNSVNFMRRDIQLRNFWLQEPSLASALYTISIRDAAYSWTITGNQPRTVKVIQNMLHNADMGQGWLDFILKWRLDYLTQDNGAFFEVIRQSDSPDSPVMGINHLDAGRCRRTGVEDWPIIYTDRLGRDHKMKPWQVVATSDFPSPIETANGVGLCAVSRVLRQAQFMRDTGIRDRERTSGMDPKTLHIVSGVGRKEMEDVLNVHKDAQIQQGNIRYSKPAIMSTIDPEKAVTTATLDLAPSPDGFNYDERMKWYITLLAMALGVDYQDLAPLPSRGIGGSSQSLILHQKSKGKGPELFMKTIEHIMNFRGILPKNVSFEYNEKDAIEDQEHAELLKLYAESGEKYITAGIFSDQAWRNIMLDNRLISQEIFDISSAGAADVTPETTAEEDTPVVAEQPTTPVQPPPQVPEAVKEKLAPFANDERMEWEETLFRDVSRGLSKIFEDIKKKVL